MSCHRIPPKHTLRSGLSDAKNQLADHSNKWRDTIQSTSFIGEMDTDQIPQGDPEVFWLDFAALYVMPLEQWIFTDRDLRVDVASTNQSSKYLNIENPSTNKRIPKRELDGFTGDKHLRSALRVVDRHS